MLHVCLIFLLISQLFIWTKCKPMCKLEKHQKNLGANVNENWPRFPSLLWNWNNHDLEYWKSLRFLLNILSGLVCVLWRYSMFTEYHTNCSWLMFVINYHQKWVQSEGHPLLLLLMSPTSTPHTHRSPDWLQSFLKHIKQEFITSSFWTAQNGW